MKLFLMLIAISLTFVSCTKRTETIPDELFTREVAFLDGSQSVKIDSTHNKYRLYDIMDYRLTNTSFNVPVVDNKKVRKWISYFTGRGRKWFEVYLERSPDFIPVLQPQLERTNMPTDLVYLAMIESGFNTKAHSRASAVGPWQFIRGTGKRYGLDSDWWMDERRCPEKSTLAAIAYLKELFEEFNSWELAAAAYNAGENKVRRAIKRYRTTDFWQLSRHRYLRRETRNYVPKFFAATIIAKNPEVFGFTPPREAQKRETDYVEIKKPVNLELFSKYIDTPVETVKKLNPELTRWCTPPYSPSYFLEIPAEKRNLFTENEQEIYKHAGIRFKKYRIRRGDTFYRMARRFGVSRTAIKRLNPGTRYLVAKRTIVLPVPETDPEKGLPLDELSSNVTRSLASIPVYSKKRRRHRRNRFYRRTTRLNPSASGKARIHVVKKGETLWHISNAYNVKVRDLRRWNRLNRRDSYLLPGDRIIVRTSGRQKNIGI